MEENEGLSHSEPLETDLNALFQLDEDLKDDLTVLEKCLVCPLSVLPIGLLDHLKLIVADCRIVLG